MNVQSDDLSHNERNNIASESETNILPQYQITNFQKSFSEEDSSDIKQLLISWDLSDIVDTCLKELIDISILKSMDKSQSEKLLTSFPYGIQIKFWNCLKSWQSKLIVDYFKNHGKLNDTCRNILVEIIIAYMVRHEKPMSIKVAQNISLQIISAFPTEIKFKFSQCENMLTNYDKIFDKLLSLIKVKVKDPAAQKVLTEMENTDIDENGRNACIFYLIHSVLVPTSKIMKKDNNKRSLIKYSIKDSQLSFIIFAHTVEEIEETISALREKGDPIQPFVMVVGTILKPKEILGFFDYAKFKVYSVVRAVDICFKIIHLFHLKYPLKCTMSSRGCIRACERLARRLCYHQTSNNHFESSRGVIRLCCSGRSLIATRTHKSLSITSDQKEALVEFMKNQPDLRKGKFSINFTTAIAKSQWEECRILLNSIPGPAKEWQERRKVIINR
ncbi:hypothetical protein ACI65C_006866 [Semiaphis heraclei]